MDNENKNLSGDMETNGVSNTENTNELYSSAPNAESGVPDSPEEDIADISTEEVTKTDGSSDTFAEKPKNDDFVPPVYEPTVTFDAVVKETHTKNTGIKVFFTLISVTVALIIALSVGFIFGKANGDTTYNITAPNIASKENLTATDYTGVYNKTAGSVVSITTYNTSDGSASTASGLIYTADGYIVTNDHIYAEITSPKFLVTLYDGSEYYAKFIAGDTRSDLAVLKIEATGLTPVTFGDYSELAVGEQVVAVGCPGGVKRAIPTGGIISSVGTRISTSLSNHTMKVIQTDTSINPGSSGGALVNMYGQVVGITSAKLTTTTYENTGFAIPSTMVVGVADSLIKNRCVVGRGKLGVTYSFVDSVTADLNAIPKGMLIDSVSSDSALINENLKKGDIITHINDIELTDRDVALDIIEATQPGVSISVKVYHPSTKSSEVIYTSLIEDIGSSSYSENVAGGGGNGSNGSGFNFDIFGDNSDSYSDH